MVERWVRFADGDTQGFGLLEGEAIRVHAGDMFEGATPTGAIVTGARLLAPVVPGVFIGLWNNFHEAAARQGLAIPTDPLWFVKSPRSLAGPGDAIRPPPGYAGRVLYEGELGLVIGRSLAHASEAEAEAAIFGLTCVNDVTALDLLTADASFPQWARAKGCDGFGPIGPCIATGLDWRALRVTVALNGRVRQDYPLSDMILPPARIIAAISQEMTLHPGDVIACGTSLGALPMRAGMQVAVSITEIGVLENPFG